jgi:outer membrane protein W
MKRQMFGIAAGAMLVSLLTAAPAFAQDGYMFGMPRVSLTLRGGVTQPAANSEIFNFFTDRLTLDRSDFRSANFGADLGIRVHRQADVLVSVDVSQSTNDSHFRDFVEDNDAEIRQTTSLTRVPATVGLKLHLLPRGRSISRYAFIPSRVSPYVGGGVGAMFYTLEQYGDFVDEETLDIWSDTFESDGASFAANAFVGGDFWLGSRVALNLEGRYNWAEADLNYDFSDFDQIDLRGWQLTAGITLRY